MEISRNTKHFAKRIATLEAQCNQLKEEKIALKEALTEAKGKEEEMIEKYAKEKDKYMKVKEEFSSEKSKWREDEENIKEICRQEGVAKRKLEIDLKAAKRRITNVSVEAAQKLMDKDVHFKGLLEESNGTISTLLANNEALNTRYRRLEMDFEAQMTTVKEEFDSKGKKWREEEQKIREECRLLSIEKRNLEIDLKAAKRGIEEGGNDVAEKLKAAKAETEGFKILLDEKDRTITTLLANNETLKRQNSRLEMGFLPKKQKVEEKILELTRKIEVLEGRRGQMEAEYCKLKENHINEAEKIFNVNKAFEAKKKRLDRAKQKINELVNWIGVLERDKEAERMAMEEEGKKKVSELTCRIEVLEREKREIEAKACQANKKTSEEIERILKAVVSRSSSGNDELAKKLKVVEAESEARISFLEEKLLVLSQKIHVVEGEKVQLEAEFCKVKEDNRSEVERVCYLNKKVETEKKRKRARTKINELIERIKEKEAEKGAMENVGKKKISEVTYRLEVLEREKREMEAEFCLVKKELTEEIKRMLNEKMIVEAREMTTEAVRKKMDLEFVQRIEVLEREKRGLEAEVREAKREKSEEIKKILNENTALKEKHTKEIMNLVSKYGILEREKQRSEVETRETFKRIKLLGQEKEHSVTTKKKMVIDMNRCVVKSNKDVNLPQQLHSASGFGVLSTPTTENQGIEIQKRMVEGPACSEVNRLEPNGSKLNSLTIHETKCKVEDVASPDSIT